jgi:hypothetical protein
LFLVCPIFPLWSFTHAGKYFFLSLSEDERKFLLNVHKNFFFVLRYFFSLVSEREIWKHNFFFLCVWNSALDGLRDSSLSSFFQLYVGKKSFFIFCVFFSFFSQSNTHSKTWSAFVIFYLLLIFLSCSLFYKHINMLNLIHIIFLFFEDIYFCLFIYLWIFFHIFSQLAISYSSRESSAFLSVNEKFL